MNHLFSSGSKKLQTIVFINTLLLSSISMVYAQSQNINGEKNTRKPVVTEEKLSNKSDATNEPKKRKRRNQSKS